MPLPSVDGEEFSVQKVYGACLLPKLSREGFELKMRDGLDAWDDVAAILRIEDPNTSMQDRRLDWKENLTGTGGFRL